jgi:hypothetical protein
MPSCAVYSCKNHSSNSKDDKDLRRNSQQKSDDKNRQKIKEKAFEIRTMFLKLQMLISFFASMPHIIIKYTFSDL